MNTKVIVVFTLGGLESVNIVANSEDEEKAGAKLLEPIRPCLDIADAIIKKVGSGPQGERGSHSQRPPSAELTGARTASTKGESHARQEQI